MKTFFTWEWINQLFGFTVAARQNASLRRKCNVWTWFCRWNIKLTYEKSI